MKRFEDFVFHILDDRSRKMMVILLTLAALAGSVLMLPSKIVKAKMLPGKSDNTFSVYIDTPTGSSKEQTYKVGRCVIEHLQNEPEILNMEIYAGMGIPLDYAGLVKGAGMKNSENVGEISVNLTDKHERDETDPGLCRRGGDRSQSQEAPGTLRGGGEYPLPNAPSGRCGCDDGRAFRKI